jgi:transaldolase
MITNSYLKWLSGTDSFWWNDSAVLSGMEQAIKNGATGVTTNPLLVKRSLFANPGFWQPFIQGAKGLKDDEKAEEIIRSITVEIAKKFELIHKETDGVQGYVCAQVNPNFQGDSDKMFEMGKRLASWAVNIAIKLPATAAGIEAMEELSALGITTVGTVSFTTSQAVEIARRQQMGIERAKKAGKKPGAAFSVIMVGRLDDYLRDVAHDMHSNVQESDIMQAGTACIKHAYAICKDHGYASKLMPAGMRGAYHAIARAGADMSMALAANIQSFLEKETEHAGHIGESVPKDVIDRLMTIPEFVRAYEPEGMTPSEFITFGTTQRTLSQFLEAGWLPIQEFEV